MDMTGDGTAHVIVSMSPPPVAAELDAASEAELEEASDPPPEHPARRAAAIRPTPRVDHFASLAMSGSSARRSRGPARTVA
jgi:hypothetical protein